jgi:hypothetical protein
MRRRSRRVSVSIEVQLHGVPVRIGVGYWSVCRWSVWAVFKLVIDDVLTA